MSPRTKQIADNDVARHAADLLIEAGRDAVTLAEVAKRCGLAPPTLIQRFGRKEALMLAAVTALRARLATTFSDSARQHPPLRALTHALQSLASLHAALIQLPTLGGDQAGYALELRKQISFALAMGIEAGELPRCDVAMLARTLQITFTGAVATALLEGSDPRAEVAAAIETQLANYV